MEWPTPAHCHLWEEGNIAIYSCFMLLSTHFTIQREYHYQQRPLQNVVAQISEQFFLLCRPILKSPPVQSKSPAEKVIAADDIVLDTRCLMRRRGCLPTRKRDRPSLHGSKSKCVEIWSLWLCLPNNPFGFHRQYTMFKGHSLGLNSIIQIIASRQSDQILSVIAAKSDLQPLWESLQTRKATTQVMNGSESLPIAWKGRSFNGTGH